MMRSKRFGMAHERISRSFQLEGGKAELPRLAATINEALESYRRVLNRPCGKAIDRLRIEAKIRHAGGAVRFLPVTEICLFVTRKKPANRTQYVDSFAGDILHWQGQSSGRTENNRWA